MAERLTLGIVTTSEEFAQSLVARIAACGLEPAYSTASSPMQITRMLLEEPWDMVIVDGDMHNLPWQETLMLARTAHASIPFALILSAPDPQLATLAIREGVDAVLAPEDWHLGHTLVRLLQEGEQRRERASRWHSLTREARKWRGMVENAQIGIFHCRPWGALVHANPSFARIFGFASVDAMLSPATPSMCTTFPLVPLMPDVLQTLGSTGVLNSYEACLQRNDGEPIWVSINASVQRGKSGEITAIEGTVEDIHRRKMVEQMIIQAKQEWEKTFDSVPDVIAILDDSNRIRRCNMALGTLLGLHPRDLVGTDCASVFSTDDNTSEFLCTLARGESRTEELYMPRLGGHFLVTLSPYYPDGAEGTPASGTVLIAHDISARKQLEAQLRQARKMEAIGTLAGGIAHDFNNILGVMMGYTEMSLDQAEADTSLHRRLTEVLTAGKRARDLIHQILTISRQEEPSRQLVSVGSIMEETARLMRATLPANVQLHTAIATQEMVLANESQMQQVVMNLCTNGAHAMREAGGQLTLSLTTLCLDDAAAAQHGAPKSGSYVCLRVQDTGHGIPADIMESIFDPFFTTKKPNEGTGMGLALAHGIVTSHGGGISCSSTPGAGTTFEVLLPVATSEGTRHSPSCDIVHTGKGRALIVDDEAPLAALMGEILTSFGYDATVRTSPEEALTLFTESPHLWGLVMTDQNMQEMTGLELATTMLRIRPDLPVVLCTGYSESLTPESARAAGIAALLFKPLLKADIVTALAELGQHPAGAGE